MTTNTVVGQPVGRVEGPEKVSGRAKYALDKALPGMLWCKVLRSPYPHARVVRIDATKALQLPGVHAVLTGEDVRDLRGGVMYVDEPVLASWDRVRFIGDKVAAVAADDADIAERALGLIEVQYEELPAVFDAEEAARPDAPILHPDFNTYRGVQPIEAPSNVYGRMVHEWGDLQAGFAQADAVVERTYRTPRAHQTYLEPHSCIVGIDPDGKVQVWVSNQAPTARRPLLARLMGLPREQVVINPSYIGGAFGGKLDGTGVVMCYLLAKKTGRPVKFVMDYSEELQAMNPRHPSTIRMKVGIKRDGTITAWEAEGYFATGGYAAYAPVPALGGLLTTTMVEPYRVPNARLVSIQVYTNTVPCGYFRGPGMYQSVFASESHMDEVARAIGMDPLDFRLKNAIRTAEEARSDGGWKPPLASEDPAYRIRLADTLRAAAETAGYHDKKPAHVGRGISVHSASTTGYDGHAAVSIYPDGRIVANMIVYDPGMGTATILAQIIAEELDVPVERIEVEPWSTENGPRDFGVSGQRGARVISAAAYDASQDAKGNLKRLAAEFFGWSEERIEFHGGHVVNGASGQSVALEEVAARAGHPVTGRGDVDEPRESPYASFATHIAEVSVDPETGEVRLLRYTAAHETGRILNPTGFQGQIDGGIMQGVGHALMEELRVEDGRVTNPSLADYKIPNAADIPELRTVILDSGVGHGPYKVRGIGDMPIVLPAAAIANAVADACGARIAELPITAEKVYRALRSSQRPSRSRKE